MATTGYPTIKAPDLAVGDRVRHRDGTMLGVVRKVGPSHVGRRSRAYITVRWDSGSDGRHEAWTLAIVEDDEVAAALGVDPTEVLPW